MSPSELEFSGKEGLKCHHDLSTAGVPNNFIMKKENTFIAQRVFISFTGSCVKHEPSL